MNLIIGILLSAIAFVLGAKIMDSVEVKSFSSAILTAIVVSILNGTIGTIVYFLGTPINWLTLGLFNFLVSATFIYIAAKFLSGFNVRSFWSAFILAFVITFINWVLQGVTGYEPF